jgi:hypothetical protein
LRGQSCGELVDVAIEIAPGACRSWHMGLAPEFAFYANFPSDRRKLFGKRRQSDDHVVDCVGQLRYFAFRLEKKVALEITLGHRRDHLSDAANLTRQVARHKIDAVSQILPRP